MLDVLHWNMPQIFYSAGARSVPRGKPGAPLLFIGTGLGRAAQTSRCDGLTGLWGG